MAMEAIATMDSLPLELLWEITSYLDTVDIKNLRLVFRRLRDGCNKPLFEKIYLSCHPLDLEAFQAITQDPVLSKQVRNIIYDVSSVEGQAPFPYDFFEERLLRPVGINDPLPLSPRSIKTGYYFWTSMAASFFTIQMENLDMLALTQAIPRLPNLQMIRITQLAYRASMFDGEDQHGRDGGTFEVTRSPTFRKWTAMKAAVLNELCTTQEANSPWNRAHFSYLFNSCFHHLLPIAAGFDQDTEDIEENLSEDGFDHDNYDENSFDVDDWHVRVPRPPSRVIRGVLMSLLQTLPEERPNFNALEITRNSVHENDYMGPHIRVFMSKFPEIHNFGQVLQNLKILKLGLNMDVNRHEYPPKALYKRATTGDGELSQFLSEATSLEELELCLPGLSILDALDQKVYPKLRTITLNRGIIKRLPLISFLESHSATLKCLEISHCKAFDSWEAILKAVMHRRGFDLQQCHLKRLVCENDEIWDTPSSEEVINYFKTGQKYPLVRTNTIWRSNVRPGRPDRFFPLR
jgi:hypothetical protein